MIAPCLCENETEIRRMLLLHEHELVSEEQEVRIAWRETQEIPTLAILTGYEPPGDSEYADALGVFLDGEVFFPVPLSRITYFEVLATKRMTSKVAYQQMKEMEHAAGLVPKGSP